MFPALAGGFITTSTTWEALSDWESHDFLHHTHSCIYPIIHLFNKHSGHLFYTKYLETRDTLIIKKKRQNPLPLKSLCFVLMLSVILTVFFTQVNYYTIFNSQLSFLCQLFIFGTDVISSQKYLFLNSFLVQFEGLLFKNIFFKSQYKN